MAEVLYVEEGPVARITLNRPEALNAFNWAARLGVVDALRRASESPRVRAVVLAGAGRGFSAGADLTEPLPSDGVSTMIKKEYLPGILAIERLAKPVVAAVHGFATGIGVSYVLACDLVVMGEGAFMQLPFAKIALIPDGGLCWQLSRSLGHRLAYELAMEGERIAASRCRELGLVNRVVADERVLDEAIGWATRLADKAPLALAGTKRAMHKAQTASLEEVMEYEAHLQQQCTASRDFKEGVSAFFEKRAPRFEGK